MAGGCEHRRGCWEKQQGRGGEGGRRRIQLSSARGRGGVAREESAARDAVMHVMDARDALTHVMRSCDWQQLHQTATRPIAACRLPLMLACVPGAVAGRTGAVSWGRCRAHGSGQGALPHAGQRRGRHAAAQWRRADTGLLPCVDARRGRSASGACALRMRSPPLGQGGRALCQHRAARQRCSGAGAVPGCRCSASPHSPCPCATAVVAASRLHAAAPGTR